MDDEPEVIRQQMEATRSSMTEKIEKLEHQVVGTVQSTTQAVTNTVESVKEAVASVKDTVTDTVGTVKDTVTGTVSAVKDSVGEAVCAVKESLDLRAYVEQYPWASFGAAVAAGYVGGCLLGAGGRARGDRITGLHSRGETYTQTGPAGFNGGVREQRRDVEAAARESRFTAAPAHAEPSWVGKLGAQFAPEMDKLKGLALGVLGAFARDLVTRAASGQLASNLSGLVDDVTRKLGGEPIQGSLLQNWTGGATAGKSSRDREAVSEAHAARASAGL